MSIFYFAFFFVIGYLFLSILKERNFLKFVFSLFGMRYEKNKKSVEDAVFLYEEPKKEELSEEENFALALGDLEHERLLSELEEINILQHLENEWGLNFEKEKSKEHTLYTLQQIWSQGTLALILQNIQLEKEVSVRDMVAFDSARFTELLRQVLYMKFIEEEQAWGLLFLNAQRVQDSYASWHEFKDAYFRGLTLYMFDKLEDEKKESFDFKKALMEHQENSTLEVAWLDEEIFSHFETHKNEI